jgi:subtilisin family serine protease
MRRDLFINLVCLLMISFTYLSAGELIIPDKFISAPEDPVLSQKAERFLQEKASKGNIKIWVFFTDKGVINADEYVTRANLTQAAMTERTSLRRQKNNASSIRFNDLPVETNYVNQIENYGLKLRRVSKWLNAASFETTFDKLTLIAELPFILKIQPVATYTRVEPEDNDEPIDKTRLKNEKRDLIYGDSYGQLNQINVIAAHNAGYSGDGVIVAMFDTGFRRTHNAFSSILFDGRLIAEYDFVFDDYNTMNEPEDVSNQWTHGTETWSTLGGSFSGALYGPAYGATFVICKTEDMRGETQAEEDDWVAAAEWVDSIGVDIISSSLSYSDWYTASDYDGNTCVTTIAADYAASVGILVCNSAGNGGPGSSTLGAPADADSIITVGGVYNSGAMISFSSRGPTYDGRIKPEVCAQGSAVTVASPTSITSITTASGTSFSCPLTGGVAALVMEAHPDWTVMQVREAMMMTASDPDTPDNAYGWGIVNAMAAINYSFLSYQKGDPNADALVNISDAVYIINYVFVDGPEPLPELLAGDANNDNDVDVSDATFLVNYIFIEGSPAPPGL